MGTGWDLLNALGWVSPKQRMQNTVMACGLRERGKGLWGQVCKGGPGNDESGAIGESSQHDTQMTLLSLKLSNYKLTPGMQIYFDTMCIYGKKQKM